MTSPAVLVLCVALVCFTNGIATERTANHYIFTSMRRFTDKTKYNVSKVLNISDLAMEFITNTIKNTNNHVTNEGYSKIKYNSKTDDFDDIYKENNSSIVTNLELHKINLERFLEERRTKHNINSAKLKFKRLKEKESIMRIRVRRENDDKCETFQFNSREQKYISHPQGRNSENNNYDRNANCVTIINGTVGEVIQLTFVDKFHIEYHPECAYDFLEIRDGLKGYSKSLGKVCGTAVPRQITTSGPNVWLKFKSDETIEYEGFRISIQFIQSVPNSRSIPETCYKTLIGPYGMIDSNDTDQDCITKSADQALDLLWTIVTPVDTKIYLNFTHYSLRKPNECEDNVIQVFGYELEDHAKLAHYCGSVANSVMTKGVEGTRADKGNIMYVRMYASKVGRGSSFVANYTAFRTIDPNRDDDLGHCNRITEVDCEDNTCIDIALKCDGVANCRLKADEEHDDCKDEAASVISKPDIIIILVMFSLIISGMSFVFLFECIRKLYQDHKIIKEQNKPSFDERLDSLVDSRLALDPKRLERDSDSRESLERENHNNEQFNQQRKFSHKVRPASIDSDFIHETHLDLDNESWRRDVERGPIDPEEVRIERNEKTRKGDISKKKESIRSKTSEKEEKREIKDASVDNPDTKESGCQTRESLFQTETAHNSDASATTKNQSLSISGYCEANIVRLSPPSRNATNISDTPSELLSQVTSHPESHKKMVDRRPISTGTTRSAPDVIIVSKQIF